MVSQNTRFCLSEQFNEVIRRSLRALMFLRALRAFIFLRVLRALRAFIFTCLHFIYVDANKTHTNQ